MAVIHDFKCEKHGYFESRKPQCPMKGCDANVLQVFLQAPGLVSSKTKNTDKTVEQLAIQFGMSDIKSTREGEHQTGFLTRNNKFTEKEYQEAEKFATRKRGVNKDKLKNTPPPPPETKEARPGDAAIWGGGFKGLDMKSLLTGRPFPSVKDETVGMMPSQAGITHGPRIDPTSTLIDHEGLKIKP